MASRVPQAAADTSAGVPEYNTPLSLSTANQLLASIISLPQNPSILYATYTPSSTRDDAPSIATAEDAVEMARRLLVHRNKSTGTAILDSILPCVRIGDEPVDKGAGRRYLHIFAVTAVEQFENTREIMDGLQFDGLVSSSTSSFTPQDLYPCSATCALQRDPCPACLSQSLPQHKASRLSQPEVSPPATPSPSRGATTGATSASASTRLPRHPLRAIYAAFLSALRDRLVSDIAEAALTGRRRQVRRFKEGFLLGSVHSNGTHSINTEEGQGWGASWEHHARMRPLIYCQLSLNLTPTRITIHPVLRPTPYLPVSSAVSLSPSLASLSPHTQGTSMDTGVIPTGTPVTLLPYAVPAYFLTRYVGPTTVLTAQFEAALEGLGVGRWQHANTQSQTQSYQESQWASWSQSYSDFRANSHSHSNKTSSASYVILWISVENEQGEDKGMTVIWPEALCLAYHPSSSRVREPLAYVPTLPTQLQPSPLPPSPPAISFVAPTAPSTPHTAGQSTTRMKSGTTLRLRPGLTRRVLTASTLDSFRSLSLSLSHSLSPGRTKDLGGVAAEVGAYVDSVARERERERERIRREREVGGSPPKAGASIALAPSTSSSGVASGNAVRELQQLNESSVEAAGVVPPLGLGTAMDKSYPSPPTTVPPLGAPTAGYFEPSTPILPALVLPVDDHPSPILEPESKSPLTTEPPVLQQPPTPTSSSHPAGIDTFDPFAEMGMDAAWAQPQQDYMNLDYDMGFGMPADVVGANAGVGGGGAADSMMMNDFEDGFTFTDDDFSFFDQPAAHPSSHAHSESRVVSGASLALSHAEIGGLTPAPFGLSPAFYGDTTSGPGLTSTTPGQYPASSPWVPGGLAEGFTPALSSPSPGKTQSSNSAPTTPTVQLSPGSDYRSASKGNLSLRFGPSIFDPIPFAVSHRISDGKYASGKFALSLPSPPDEEDRTADWKTRYSVATDPRIGVVRKLIGVKRKTTDQGARDARISPSWLSEHEDWANSLSPDHSAMKVDHDAGGKSDESEDEDMALDDSPMFSRPSTPPPAYLPLGHTLLQTQFRHAELLPLCTPLRSPGEAVVSTAITAAAAAASVPTPVSPAAALGAASEISKSLEAAAYTVAKEAVENPVWADAWRASMLSSGDLGLVTEVWQADVMSVVHIFEDIPTLEVPLDMKALFDLDSNTEATTFGPLEPPMFTVAKSDAIMQVLPTALRFWEKLGLGPRGGRKNVTAFVLFEDEGEERQLRVERWLNDMSATYSARHLGSHTAGQCSSCPKDGIVPLSFDSFRKNLASFVSGLPAFESSVVLYMVTPSCTMDLASPILRQLFSGVKRALKTYSEAQIVFQFVPEQLITDSLEHSSTREANLERLCHTLYERVLLPVDRNMSRRFFEHGERVRNYFQEPAFTLARPVYGKVRLLRQTPLRSLDIVDRHTLLHVGYCISPCGKWLFAACVDQRGEAHELGVWILHSDVGDAQVVAQVWDFAVRFARRANVEWRIVFAKLGSMGESELDAWISHLAIAVPACNELPMVHASVLAVEQGHPWAFIAPKPCMGRLEGSKRSTPKDTSRPLYVDASAGTYAIFPSTPLALPTSSSAPELSFIPSTQDAPLSSTLPLLPLSSTALIRSPADGGYTAISTLHIHLLYTLRSPHSSLDIPDSETHREITHNFYELSVLAAARWKLDTHADAVLPLHLGALQVMCHVLGRGDVELS